MIPDRPTLTGRAVRVSGSIAPQFLARHALSPADAIPFAPHPREVHAFAALRESGAIKQAEGGYWLDLQALSHAEARRQRRLVPFAIAAALILALLLMLFYRG